MLHFPSETGYSFDMKMYTVWNGKIGEIFWWLERNLSIICSNESQTKIETTDNSLPQGTLQACVRKVNDNSKTKRQFELRVKYCVW